MSALSCWQNLISKACFMFYFFGAIFGASCFKVSQKCKKEDFFYKNRLIQVSKNAELYRTLRSNSC
jgi:hypothetical protein